MYFKTMQKYILPVRSPLKIAASVLIVIAAAATDIHSQSGRPSRLSSALVLPAGFISYNVREGYRKYDDVKEPEHVGRNNMFMFGTAGGKRFALKNPRLRIQSALEFGRGSIDEEIYEDAVQYTNGLYDDVIVHNSLLTIGIQTELHLLFPVNPRHCYFLSIGPNVGWNIFTTTYKTGMGIEVTKPNRVDNTGFGLNLGAGMEYFLNKKNAVSVGYNLRIWRPVAYNDLSIFPMGVDYKELFFTNMLQVQILFPPSRAARSTNNSLKKRSHNP
jgi:hypothetical protein